MLSIQYHRTPKYIGSHKTIAASYIRFFWNGKFLFDIDVPKYGRE